MTRDQRGVALPSSVVLLSIVAVVMAVVAFVVTGGTHHDGEREITPAADTPSASAPAHPHATRTKHHHKKPKPPVVKRSAVDVEVFNNTNIHGLAATVASKASAIGWQVVGADNWVGTVPATTVYYPLNLKAAGKLLALDLGIKRTHVAETSSMKADRLTIVLTGPLS